ncbi:hypothetical protein EVAR_9077_1 [Eumeta japonica]|uniref:Uncharacterized protein n=1 Tax=Eumeta variegata TaxID=151549 RepID=A0A4C1TW11_EUMVA|nr:hypothetical protein EVAR_9077_1 [Eumeta japonica]
MNVRLLLFCLSVVTKTRFAFGGGGTGEWSIKVYATRQALDTVRGAFIDHKRSTSPPLGEAVGAARSMHCLVDCRTWRGCHVERCRVCDNHIYFLEKFSPWIEDSYQKAFKTHSRVAADTCAIDPRGAGRARCAYVREMNRGV